MLNSSCNINSNNLDNPRQSAYKSGHSTETALLLIKNEIHLSLSRGEPTALVLLDLSAAFDTIDHPTLLSCLKSWFGVSGTALKWFTSYLSHRFQAIKIGSTLSDLHELLFGVPQGSVLGPLLFSLLVVLRLDGKSINRLFKTFDVENRFSF